MQGPYPPPNQWYPAARPRRQGMLVGGIILVVLGALMALVGTGQLASRPDPAYLMGYFAVPVGMLVGGIVMIVRSSR
ncbi:MAG: hypothetical protein FWF02_06100 [Micrococcales bacterium]|nr:hypothetical protein [Micrococcales bacterium]MCL2667263.1 hypothetical protein [Micrococcales bacterium]